MSDNDRKRGRIRGQSAPVAIILLVSLTLLGTAAVVAIGGSAIDEVEGDSGVSRAKQSMTLFDSQAAQVALGDSRSQSVEFGFVRGDYNVDPTAGKMEIIHIDHDDDGDSATSNDDADDLTDPTDPIDDGAGTTDDDVTVYSADLGTFTYSDNDRTIGYQGGGVWLSDGQGSTVVSPPEFHYRGSTLTLPVILTRGDGSISGQVSASVSLDSRGTKVYPKPGTTYPSPDTEPYLNPIRDGRVVVRIESRFAKAWGEYFDQRTDGRVIYPEEGVVIVELVSLGQLGRFEMPGDGGYVTVPGASGDHNTPRFVFTIDDDPQDSADMSNLKWSMYVDNGQEELEIHLRQSDGSKKCDENTIGSTDIEASLTIYYTDDGGTTYQGWKKDDAIAATCTDSPRDGDSTKETTTLEVDLVDDAPSDGNSVSDEYESGDDFQLEYMSLSNSDLGHFNPNGNLDSSATLDGHGAAWEAVSPSTGSPGTTLAPDQLLNHYFAQLPNEFRLYVDDQGPGNGNTVNEDASGGVLDTSGSGKYVTYLHVTENVVDVELRDD